MRFASLVPFAFAACVVSFPRVVRAEAFPTDWHLSTDGSLGYFAVPGSDLAGGVDLGLTSLLRWRFIEMGGQFNLGAQVPLLSPAERLGVGGLAGIGLHGSSIGGELLLEGGASQEL
jgi:hypothetical protein